MANPTKTRRFKVEFEVEEKYDPSYFPNLTKRSIPKEIAEALLPSPYFRPTHKIALSNMKVKEIK